ncbi:hypothetical protein [Paraburkholderia sp. A1RO-1]
MKRAGGYRPAALRGRRKTHDVISKFRKKARFQGASTKKNTAPQPVQ